jgi:hypothetical protein
MSSRALSAPATQPSANPMARFARLLRTADGSGTFQTSTVSYRNSAGVTVDLIGAVHIGARRYYQTLNREFATYPMVLYELIVYDKDEKPQKPTSAPPPQAFWDKSMQRHLAEWLSLDQQLDWIDYTSKHFVHADVDVKGLDDLNEQEYGTGAEAIGKMVGEGLVQGLRANFHPPPVGPMDLLEVMRAGPDQIARRRALVAKVMSADISAFGDDAVIVGRRNRVAMEKLKQILAAPSAPKRIAIFYGAAHLPGMEKILIDEMGFAPVDASPSWRDVWTFDSNRAIGATTQPATAPTSQPSNQQGLR